MKYKVGDKVKIKTWEKMEREYGLDERGSIDCRLPMFIHKMEGEIKEVFPDRILTIKRIKNNNREYRMVGIDCDWIDEMIECKIEEEVFEPINNRFEIMDL